jgi:hypothetical protein
MGRWSRKEAIFSSLVSPETGLIFKRDLATGKGQRAIGVDVLSGIFAIDRTSSFCFVAP